MLTTGLLSITFRKLSAERVIELAVEAGLASIEWGGDIHVPHGDVETARLVHQKSIDAGVSISAYGSYYRLGEASSPSFSAVLDTAVALEAPLIRVWAGARGSADVDTDYVAAVVADAQRICSLARERQILIGLEYHDNTLTDSLESTSQLLEAVNQDNLMSFWQPPHTHNLEQKIYGLRTLLPRLANVHVFHWNPDDRARFPLGEGESDWQQYLAVLRESDQDHVLSLEFVKGDDEGQFLADARLLRHWLEAV